ncbi:peptidase, partial [Escherichia coli]|nr:peptidase [Escherichia coli]
ISRPAATFFLRASGESMNQAGMYFPLYLILEADHFPEF